MQVSLEVLQLNSHYNKFFILVVEESFAMEDNCTGIKCAEVVRYHPSFMHRRLFFHHLLKDIRCLVFFILVDFDIVLLIFIHAKCLFNRGWTIVSSDGVNAWCLQILSCENSQVIIVSFHLLILIFIFKVTIRVLNCFVIQEVKLELSHNASGRQANDLNCCLITLDLYRNYTVVQTCFSNNFENWLISTRRIYSEL